jgi:hypothetical protein
VREKKGIVIENNHGFFPCDPFVIQMKAEKRVGRDVY